MIGLRFYPRYIHDNPYIELFYRALEGYGVESSDGLVVNRKTLGELSKRIDVLHFQWCPKEIWRSEGASRRRGAFGEVPST